MHGKPLTALLSAAVLVGACSQDPAPSRLERGAGPPTTAAPAAVEWPGVGSRWSQVPAGPADGRVFPVEVWTGDELIIWGGETVSEGDWSRDGAALDPATGTWRPLAPAPLTARSEHAAVWTGTEVIVCCGRAPDGGAEAAAAYDPATDTWTELAPPPFAAQFPVAAWTGDRMIVTGGITDGGQGQAEGTWAYDPDADQWTELGPAPAVIERDADAAWTGDRLLVWPRVFTEVAPMAYDPDADEWTLLPRPPVRLTPDNGSMVWTGDELIVWGVGQYPSDTDAVGARLAPDGRSWRTLADDPLPPVDWYEGTPGSNAAVWTGEEMVVWTGGVGPREDHPVVLAYDPTADRWRELDRAPRGAHNPTMLWTGDVVLALTDRVLAIRP